MSVAIDLSGKLALVTGGTRGIGLAVVRTLARAGARVAFSYRESAAIAGELVAELAAEGHQAKGFRCAFESPEAAETLVDAAESTMGATCDIFVANAGIWERSTLEALDLETLRRTLHVNVEAAVLGARRVAPGMIDKGWGRIVMIGSTAGQRGEAGHSAYALSKGALQLFARSIGAELASRGVVVNTVAPGWVATDMTARALEGPERAAIIAAIPRGRVATAEEIAGPVLFLCSDLCSHMIGSVLSVNGGSVMA